MIKILTVLLILLLVLIALAALLFIAVCLCALRGRRIRSADCILILGAKVRPDGSMSHALRFRCDRAFEAWQAGAAKTIIGCGGVCDGPVSEASVIRAYLLEKGVPDGNIIMEDQSVNTWQNLINARKIMDERGMHKALMVTSDYHLTRALWMAKKQGLSAVGMASLSSRKPALFMRTRSRECVSWILYAYNELKKIGK